MYAVIDIETTGSFHKKNAITEVAILIHDGQNIIKKYESLVNPGSDIPAFITGLTGISNAMVEEAPTFDAIAEEVFHLLKDNIFVAHNVHFDYGFVVSALSDAGYELKSDKLCTVRLGRQLIPGLSSYSLGTLCASIGIEINNRHRAMGDALATTYLLQYLLDRDDGTGVRQVMARLNKKINFPPNLDEKLVQNLPELPGIYFFKDQSNQIIYIGKAVNIKKRVVSHFTGSSKEKRNFLMREEIHGIEHQETGNELLALIIESHLIRKHWPKFNRAQKITGKKYGLFVYEDHGGYQRITMGPVKKGMLPAVVFPNRETAQKGLNEMLSAYQLCPKLCGIQKTAKACFHYETGACNGACDNHETAEAYNSRAKKALESVKEHNESFIIEGAGTTSEEFSYVLVENGIFKGYNYMALENRGDYAKYKEEAISLGDNKDFTMILNKVVHSKDFDAFYTLIHP